MNVWRKFLCGKKVWYEKREVGCELFERVCVIHSWMHIFVDRPLKELNVFVLRVKANKNKMMMLGGEDG